MYLKSGLNTSVNFDTEFIDSILISQNATVFQKDWQKFMTYYYFMMTTLAKIGYGDLFPVTWSEQIFGIVIMLIGMIFFSYVLDQFLSILQKDPGAATVLQVVDKQAQTIQLQNWLIQLQRFRENRALPPSLNKEIMAHFQDYWSNNRLLAINDENRFIDILPTSTKKAVMISYLFDDLFSEFRQFFRPDIYYNSEILLKMAYGVKPRFIRKANGPYDTEGVLFTEGQEATEMFFIQKGEVKAGFQTYGGITGIDENGYELTHKFGRRDIIGESYVLQQQKAQFLFMVTEEFTGFTISRSFLFNKVFKDQNYQMFHEFNERAVQRDYEILSALARHRKKHLAALNSKNSYFQLQLQERDHLQKMNALKQVSQKYISTTHTQVGQLAYRVDLIHKDLHNTHDQLWIFLDRMSDKYITLLEKIKASEEAVIQRHLREKQIDEYFPQVISNYEDTKTLHKL